MKDLKIINKELDKEFRKIRKSNSDDYSIIVKQQEMLVNYYEKNKDQIKIDALLDKYKKLTYDFPNIIQTAISFIIGFVSSLLLSPLLEVVLELFNEKVKDLIPLLKNYSLLVLISFIIGISIVPITKRIVKGLYGIHEYYVNPFHAKVIQNILEEKGFFVDNEKQYEKIKEVHKGK